jgi:hypothetical protein
LIDWSAGGFRGGDCQVVPGATLASQLSVLFQYTLCSIAVSWLLVTYGAEKMPYRNWHIIIIIIMTEIWNVLQVGRTGATCTLFSS